MNAVRDFLLLESMSARAAAVPEDRRRVARSHLDRARAHHLAGEALTIPSEAAQALSDALTESLAAAASLGIDDPTVAEARKVVDERDKVDLAVFSADARDAHQALYEAIAPYTLDLRTLRRAQIRRAIALVSFALAGLAALVWYVRKPVQLRAIDASGSYSGQFLPFRAVDGDTTSEWLLPDRTVGWIELEISPPRPVKKVSLMNARNTPYNDRSTGQFRVEAFYQGQPLGAGENSFSGFSAAPAWREVQLDGQRADKLKIWVKSFLESGAGFAEITIE